MTRDTFAAVFALVFLHCASSMMNAQLPSGWTVRPPAAEASPERYCFNHSEDSWLVSESRGELVIRQMTANSSNASESNALPAFLRSGAGYTSGIIGVLSILKVDRGYLVGQDGGEWGGWLRWYSDDGTQVRLILQQNTSAVVRLGARVIAVTSSQGAWESTGALQALVRDENNRWKVVNTLPLNGWARAVGVTQQNELLVATSNGVALFRNGKLRLVQAKWDLLNPSSIVKISDKIYVGMQSRVVELRDTPAGVVERWLVPRYCVRFVGDDPPDYMLGGWENCRCVPEAASN
jgi:hypothetical protein